jgi:hypothetical protein
LETPAEPPFLKVDFELYILAHLSSALTAHVIFRFVKGGDGIISADGCCVFGERKSDGLISALQGELNLAHGAVLGRGRFHIK